METKVFLFISSFLISFTQSSQNVETFPSASSTTYHSPANEVSSSFYFTQNLQSHDATHEDNNSKTLPSYPHGVPQHSPPLIQIHYSPTPVKTHPPQTSPNSLPEQYLHPLKFKSQPPSTQYLPSYFETSTTTPKSSINHFLYNQYLPSVKNYPTPPSTQYLPSSAAYQQQVVPSNQIDTVKIQNPFLVSAPFSQQNTKEYNGPNGGGFLNDYSKNHIMLPSLENQKRLHVTPKITSSVRSDLGIVSTPRPLQFSHAGGSVSHVEFSSADVNYKW